MLMIIDIPTGNNMSMMYKNNHFCLIYSTSRWNNYTIVYMIHEICHSLFGKTNVEHAIIEFITDNELRFLFNKDHKYFMYNDKLVGHDYLYDLEKEMLPYWKKYLKSKKDIYKFRNEMLKIFKK